MADAVDKQLGEYTMDGQAAEGMGAVFELAEEGISKGTEVGAALSGGWELGREADEAFGISNAISDIMPGGLSARRAEADAMGYENASPMSPAQHAQETCRLDHNVPFGDKEALAQVCGPYKD